MIFVYKYWDQFCRELKEKGIVSIPAKEVKGSMTSFLVLKHDIENTVPKAYMLAEIEKLCDVLGLITEKKEELLDADIEEMIAKRQQARKDKNFALADQIRAELAEKGILLEDTREGVKWKRA